MDDENKKSGPGKRSGPRRDGPARSDQGKPAGKPAFGKGKPAGGFGKGPRQGGGGKPFGKFGARDGDARPERADRPYRSGASGDGQRKPYVKREPGERPARTDGDRKPYVKREPGERPERADGGAKPFAKRGFGDRPSRSPEGDGGRSLDKYWGKRPGKQERQAAIAAGERADSTSEGERRPRKSFDGPRADRGDRPARPFGEKRSFGERGDQRSFRDTGGRGPRTDRPARQFADKPARQFSDKPRGGGGSDRRAAAPREVAVVEEGERIAKRLARAGISSRRDAEDLIAAGRVKVNGKVLESPAFNVSASDRIELDGTEIPAIERTRLFLFNKPAGVVTTNRDPEGRKTVFDVLPEGLPRLMTVGRLDINTEGLLLLTNDGGLARVLELPATGWLRRYRVRVHGRVDEQALAGLKDGIAVDGVFYGAVEATLEREQGSNAWLNIGLREGKNREVKNILGSLGLDVTRLIRVSYGPFQLGELGEGQVLEIKGRTLRDQLGERLVEESGANFDAEIAKPFSNKPVHKSEDRRRDEDERPVRTPRQIGSEKAGGLIKGFRRDRDDKRGDALGRLSTSRPDRDRGGPAGFKRGDGEGRGGRFARPGKPSPDGKPPFGKKPREREERPIVEPGVRKANVWMAPGARPQGKGRVEAEKAENLARKAAKTGHRGAPKRDGKPSFGKPRGEAGADRRPATGKAGETKPRGPRKGGPGADRRR